MKEFYITDDGIKLHAKLEMPEGKEKCPLVIVVHGYTGDMEETHIVGAAKAALDSGCAALRVEMYGHGKSDGTFKNHTLYKWVANMLAVVEYAQTLDFVTDICLCGHSQGGLTAILVAGLEGDRLKGLLPLAPAIVICDAARTGVLFDSIRFDRKRSPRRSRYTG